MTEDERVLNLVPASDIRRRYTERYEWGPWRVNVRTLVLVEKDGYEVDLERCTDSAETLDYVMQVAGKSWADDQTLAGLIRALNDVLYPQSWMCSMGRGIDRELFPGRLLERLDRGRLNRMVRDGAPCEK